MTQPRDLTAAAEPLTEDETLAALLDMTGDLDHAKVLRETMPQWLVEASPKILAALETAHNNSERPRARLKTLLNHLEPLDRFCAERLHAYLLSKGVEDVDVELDMFELPKRALSGVTPDLGGAVLETVTLEKHSLVQAAMQNFSAGQATANGMPPHAVLRSAATREPVAGLSVLDFINYSRELDLGQAYQRHIREVFRLSAPSDTDEENSLSYNPAATAIGQAKSVDMEIDLHIACARQHISEATYDYLLKLINADRPASELGYLCAEGNPLHWQGLNIDGACLWSVMLLSTDAPGSLPAGRFLVYMPNEPVRPWYEYEALEDFKLYLTLKLQVRSYRSFFERYLDENERLGFFKAFDTAHALGELETIPVKSAFTEFYFNAYVAKVQRDAMALAVPNAQVDEEASRQRLEDYLEIGLNVLNVAGFVVPVLGQLMTGVAIGQLLGEVFDGVEDWAHHHNAEALKHLVNVGQNLAAMAVFAAGGQVIGSLKRSEPSVNFFEKLEAIARPDHSPALWRPRLAAYRQPPAIEANWLANPKGIYQANGQSYIKIDGAAYAIEFDPGVGQWRVTHPTRASAYRPALEHNYHGGWQHVFERAQEWHDLRYTLKRLDPSLQALAPERLEAIAAVCDMSLPEARRLALEHQPLPERFNECVLRFQQQQKIADLITQLELQQPSTAQTTYTQLQALPLLPGWPKGRFFEVLDEEGYLLESHPDLAPFDYEDLSIHISPQQLKDGQVMQTLLQALSEEERSALLGEAVEPSEAPKILCQRLLTSLKARQYALHQQLYLNQTGLSDARLLPLQAAFPGLPPRVAWELIAGATHAQRVHMAGTGRVPLSLAQRARQALEQLQEDQAIMGLHLPELTSEATERIAVGMLARLPGWPKDLFLQLRHERLQGPIVAQVGKPSAIAQRTLVKSADGYRSFDVNGQPLAKLATGAEALYTALLDALPARQRAALKLHGTYAASNLRGRVRIAAQDERRRVAGYIWPERAQAEVEGASCVQAAPTHVQAFSSALVRKVNKLYPLLNDAQVSLLLEEAGTDHMSRARAVHALEQQFQALRRALNIWRSDRSAYDPQQGTRRDYRLNRHQVVKSLERSWRRMTWVLNKDKTYVANLSLDGMLRTPLPHLPPQVSFAHVEQLSLRNIAMGNEVTYFLKHFPGLRSLDVADNHISRLPEVLAQMPNLEWLCLANNQLQLTEYTRTKLAGLHSLQVLNLSQNPLVDAPDVSRIFGLRELLLRDCRLKTLPNGASRLPYLELLDLRDNDINALPEWLFELPREVGQAFNLRHNPLDPGSRQRLRDYRNNRGVGMGFLEDDIARLNEQKARELWLADQSVDRYAEKLGTWTGLKDESCAEGLFSLLAELGGTADATMVREDMHRRVWRVLEAAANDQSLREEIFQRAATPLNCDDAAAVSFSNLEVLVEVRNAAQLVEGGQLNAKPLLNLARGLFRLDQLERLAYNHSVEHPASDPLEVSLAYRTGLAQTFDLPGQPHTMRFAGLAGVTPQALTHAENSVRNAELSPRLLKYLVELPFWSDYLKRTYAPTFDRLNDPFDQRVQEVFEQSLTLGDAAYREQMNTILKEQVKAERDELEHLTQEALKQEEVGGCLVF